MIKIGIIGCGKIAQVRHIPEYFANGDAQIVAYYDINQERATQMAQKFGGLAYNSYQEILADPNIDAVSVLVANSDHAKITIQALECGKHVLCEKPMATTLEDCENMAKTAKNTGKLLIIGHNQRLTKTHKKARELILNDEIGKTLTFQTNFGHMGPETWALDGKDSWFFDPEKATFGAMADLGIHKTDLIHFLTGETVCEVSAFLGTLDKTNAQGEKIGVDDNAICIYKLTNGAVGTMAASWTNYGKENNSTIISGTKGVLKIYVDPNFSIVLEKTNGEKIMYKIDAIQTNENQTASGVIDEFIESIKQNCVINNSAEEALSAMKAIFAALESSKTGKKIIIN